MRILHWFRSDLRLADNSSLFYASQQARRGVVAVYVVAPAEWRAHDLSPLQVELRLRTLLELAPRLASLNIPLKILFSKKSDDVPRLLLGLARSVQADAVYFNREYELDESRRDSAVVEAFTKAGLKARGFTDQSFLDPASIATGNNTYFTVFTPFKRAWLKRVAELQSMREMPKVHPGPGHQAALEIDSDTVPERVPEFEPSMPLNHRLKLWPAGEALAVSHLDTFIAARAKNYKADRDFPAKTGTSGLSAALAIGSISPRQCLLAAAAANKGKLENGQEGLDTWISELIWREFYIHVTTGFPRVCMNRAFKIPTDRLSWSYNQVHFNAWKDGKTGYPIVDAAMRQLNTTGWMHNRLRMVTAMFLTKDLFIDWRWGEKYFMNNLIDGFFASNNGGWQWSASTGTDAAPYFRILSPLSQSQKFDPDGAFIRKFVPELASLSTDEIHDPTPISRHRLNYPPQIVNHSVARLRAIEAFKALKPE